jgi:hypothetical protein
MTENDNRKLAKNELYMAACHFVERQQLVVQAMSEMKLNIDAIGKFGSFGWASSASSENGEKPLDRFPEEPTGEFEKELYAVLKYAEEIKMPRKGVWRDHSGQTWNYILHGAGCLLTNSETQEPIDWDCPNPQAFDEFFFIVHLGWRLNQNDVNLQHVQGLRHEIKVMFSELVHDGLIQECPMLMGLVYTLKNSGA